MKASPNRFPRTPEVRDLMTGHVFALRATDDLEALYDLMDQHHIRHVPVVDRDGDLVGLVTQRDLARSVLGAQDLLPLSVQQEILRRRQRARDHGDRGRDRRAGRGSRDRRARCSSRTRSAACRWSRATTSWAS